MCIKTRARGKRRKIVIKIFGDLFSRRKPDLRDTEQRPELEIKFIYVRRFKPQHSGSGNTASAPQLRSQVNDTCKGDAGTDALPCSLFHFLSLYLASFSSIFSYLFLFFHILKFPLASGSIFLPSFATSPQSYLPSPSEPPLPLPPS